jgi:hypothetical protein
MGLKKRFWILFIVFGLILAASFLVQATSGNPVSKFVLDWVGSWSTFLGSSLTIFILVVAILTFREDLVSRRTTTKLPIISWVNRIKPVLRILSKIASTKEQPSAVQQGEIISTIQDMENDFLEINLLAKTHGVELSTAVEEFVTVLGDINDQILANPMNFEEIDKSRKNLLKYLLIITSTKVI